MIIIGVDYHPSLQPIGWMDTTSGESGEQRLQHNEEAEKFYRDLKERGVKVGIGMEAGGHARWFERLGAELQFELWIGDAAQIRKQRVRKPKTDRQDAQLLLRLLLEDRFPRIWVPSLENRDLRQLLWHRHRLVQMRTRIMNQLPAVALNEGVRRRKGLWSKAGRVQLGSLVLAPWATRRGQDWLAVLDYLEPRIAELTAAIEQEAEKRPAARQLMTHAGVGALTALAFLLVLGTPQRFAGGKQMGSYLGLIPSEDSSGNRRRLGTSARQATLCCVSCWCKPHRLPIDTMWTGDVSSCTWPCGVSAASPK